MAINSEHQQSAPRPAVSPHKVLIQGKRESAGGSGVHHQHPLHHFDSLIKTSVNY